MPRRRSRAAASVESGVAIDPPSAELMLYPIMQEVRAASAAGKDDSELNALDIEDVVTGYVLACMVKTRTLKGNKRIFRDTVVNARTGAIIEQWDALQSATGTGNSQYSGTVPLSTRLVGSMRGARACAAWTCTTAAVRTTACPTSCRKHRTQTRAASTTANI